MFLNIPTAIWFGALTITSLFVTASLGIAFHVYHKDVFRYHKAFAFLTLALAAIHATLAYMLWFLGIQI